MAMQLKQGRTVNAFIASLSSGKQVYALYRTDLNYHLTSDPQWDSNKHVLGPHRPVEPLKSLLFPPRQTVDTFLEEAHPEAEKTAVAIGVKNCDLTALKIHDYVFRDTDPIDPFYKNLRDTLIIISCDCTKPCDVCFCTAVGDQPYPESGFDINISPLPNERFVIEAGSDRGKALLETCKEYLEEAGDELIKQRDTERNQVHETVAEQAGIKGLTADKDYRKAINDSPESKLWETFAEDCVECGACNFVCCTCHCFLLADGLSPTDSPSRVKQWDSCLYKNFARVAGGANPRQHRAERLFNRFDKKFNYFPQILDLYACDGCGRCIEACTGKIDIRDVLRKALDEI